MTGERPSLAAWLDEAKREDTAKNCGMYLFHNGVVRETARAQVREGRPDAGRVKAMTVTVDRERVGQAILKTRRADGIFHVRVWINEGTLAVGDDIMLVLIGGDTRPHVISALESLVDALKTDCIRETEHL